MDIGGFGAGTEFSWGGGIGTMWTLRKHLTYLNLVIIASIVYITPAYSYQDISPFYRFIQETNTERNHYINVLNIGDDALLARLHLIRNAQESINIQTFLWKVDETCRFFIYELIEAAKRGVQVKVIADFNTIPKDPKLYAFLSSVHPNIKLKIYNPLTDKLKTSKLSFAATALMDFRGVNQRMHNKIFVVDNKIAITGGRNYENDYYDRGIHRNFRDRDVLIIGPVVRQMTDSFKEYWDHPLVVNITDMIDVDRLIQKKDYPVFEGKETFDLGDLFDEVDRCASNDKCIKRKLIKNHYIVRKVDFFADKPGKDEKLGELKVSRTTYELAKLVQSAKKSIVMQTPYLVVGKKGKRFFKNLIKKNPEVEILVSSNSLAAADHAHAYAFSYKNKKRYIKSFHWQIFELRPHPGQEDEIISPVARDFRDDNYFVCIHAKSYVVDQEKVWVGSYNLDPRSANLNTEVGVIIYDERVASNIEENIKRDMANANSWTVAKRKKRPLRSFISGTLGAVVEAVPIVNLWPFTYSGSYELKEGKKPVSIFDEDFYNHYKYIGPFPEVFGTGKEIEARLIKAFLGPIEPLI